MNKVVPFNTFAKSSLLSNTSVVVNADNIPLGFVFGRDAFISLLTTMDETFENKVKNSKQAFNNPAGKLIDLIEEKLPISLDLMAEIDTKKSKQTTWIPLKKVVQTLHV
jgi:hypothetical protein